MKKFIVLSASLLILIILFGVGIPFQLNVGKLNWVGNKIQYITTSKSLASLVGISSVAMMDCKGEKVCVSPINRSGFDSNVPILFEICEDTGMINQDSCRNAVLQVKIDTIKLLRAGLKR